MVNIEAYRHIKNEVADGKIVAVSKFKTIEDIRKLYEEGHRDFGENYVQELVEKQSALPRDINWHFIGHLQRNKVKYIAPFIALIQGVDSIKLLQEINKEAAKNNRIIPILLQMYVGEETSKYGLDAKQLIELLEYVSAQPDQYQNITISGLMGMSTLTDDVNIVSEEFEEMEHLFSIIKNQFFLGDSNFNILSMGMSNDYTIALSKGSNMVRIGSTIFGNR